MFQLTDEEFRRLKSQIVISNRGGPNRALPYAFTEQGVAMLSCVLRSARAVEVNIAIMRTFVQLRRLMDSNRDLAKRVEALESRYDEQFATVFDAIKRLIADDDTRPYIAPTARHRESMGVALDQSIWRAPLKSRPSMLSCSPNNPCQEHDQQQHCRGPSDSHDRHRRA